MDSELFTVGGLPNATMHRDYTPQTAKVEEVYYQAAKLMRVSRFCGHALYWLIVFLTIYVVVSVWPMMLSAWAKGLKEAKGGFTQKEGLQYLGASTSVVRDDTGWASTDSLAEAAMKGQRETSMAEVTPPKAGFRTERMTPEEKLLEQQKK